MNKVILLALLVLSVLVSAASLPDVEAATCGDGIIQAPNDNGFYERCDEGSANGDECEAGVGETCSYCSWRCTIETVQGPDPTYCGDGEVQKPNTNGLYEQCDEGTANTDLKEAPYGETVSYCSSSCTSESEKGGYCGDGICQSDYENAFTCGTDCAGGGTAPSLSVDLWANPTYVAAPATVTYSCSAAFGETPYTYTLTFGDGASRSTSTGPYGTHVYDEPGEYTMRCTVKDDDGVNRSDSELITVIELDVSPIASFTANETELFVDESFSYACEGQSGNGVLSYETFFGDGVTTSRTSGTHSYSAAGTYTAGCTVTDEDEDFDTDTETITVVERPDLKPVVDLSADPLSGDAPLYVNYTCSVTGGDAPVSSSVSFGDGDSSNTLSDVHLYEEPGVYSLSCSATDADGDSDSESLTVTVREPYVDLEPSVDLNVTPTSGHAPLTVNYACDVTGGNAPVSSRVSVGSSSTSALDGDITFDNAGTYDVVCSATDDDGDTASDSVTVTVEPKIEPLDVELIATPESGDAPLDVAYACLATGGVSSYTYSVSFGDSSSAPGANGDHVYDEPGTYTMTCVVEDTRDVNASDSVTITVREPYIDLEPSVDLSASPTSGYAPLDVNYSCDVSSGNAPVSASVNFGDGSESNALDSTHTYDEPGYYTMTCTATDSDGDTASDSVSLRVKEPVDLMPSVDLNVTPADGDAPLTVSYACVVSGGDAPVSSSVSIDGVEMSDLSGSYTFDSAGTYDVVCEATDVDGDSASDSVSVSVREKDVAPHVELSADPIWGYAPLDVNYSCDVSGGNAPVSAMVSFGDGSSSDLLDSTHSYDEPGYYAMSCTATDVDGDTASDSVSIKVKEPIAELTATLDVDPMTGTAPLEVDYACSADGGVAPYTYSIGFGDGAQTTDASGSYVYGEGSFWMTCTARDADGRKAYASTKIIVEPEPVDLKPSVELSADPTWGYAPMDVDYDCDVFGGDAPVSASLSFGDGSSSNLLDSTHTYSEPGYYTMTCTATDSDGDTASDSVSLRVKEPVDLVPSVDLNVSPVDGEAPLTIDYSCAVEGGDAPVSSSVSIDGVVMSALSGSYTFDAAGAYDVVCSAEDADSDSDSDSMAVTVREKDVSPHVELSADPTWGYAPMDVGYDCDVTGGNAPVSSSIDFGDGSQSSVLDSTHTYEEPGYYTMTCTATDADGDTAFDSVSLRVKEPIDLVPSVDLNVSPTEGEAPLTIEYVCAIEGGDAPVSSGVSVGGSSTSALEGEITFDVPGSYDVVCQATDADGDSDSDSVTVTVREKDVEPVVELSADPLEGYAPLNVDYACDVSGGNAPVESSISFGDGSQTSLLDAMHTYTFPGTYTMTCQAEDVDGDTDVEALTITVLEKGDGPYEIDFSAMPDIGVEPLTTRVACSSEGGIAPIHYVVEYDDPSLPTYSALDPVDEQVTYADYGVYDLTCTATDVFRRSISADERVVVLPDSPVDVAPDGPGDSDDLACSVTEYADEVFDYEWYRNGELVKQGATIGSSLDASETSVGDVVECIAYLPGTDYEVGRDSETITYTGPSSISFDVSPNVGEAPLEVSWTCDVEDGVEPIDYVIDVEWNSMSQSTSTASGMILVQPANYTFTCTATDVNGDSLSAQDFVEVSAVNYSDDWSISANPLEGPAPLTVVFDADTDDIPIDGEVRWDFADGLEGLGAPIAHTFPRVGTYVVTAYATLDDGRVLEKTVTIRVTPQEDVEQGIDMSRVRIQHTYAEIVGDTLYATVTVRNDAGTSVSSSTASIYLPDHNVYASTQMPRIPDGSQRTVQFFVELDEHAFDPIAVFVVQNEEIRLQDASIVLG